MGIADTYTKGRILGKGTFGEVILATHKETGEIVAIKKIRVEDKKQVGDPVYQLGGCPVAIT